MEIKAKSMGVHIAPRKVRAVAETIRKQDPIMALATLSFVKKRASVVLQKTLKSAISNAKNKNLRQEDLLIKNIDILEGPPLKRYRPSTRGRVHPYKKRTTHIKIILTDNQSQIRSSLRDPNLKSQKIESQNSKNFEKEESAEKPKS